MDWIIEKSGKNYHVLGYDENGIVWLDRDVDNFTDACKLVDEIRDSQKDQVKEQVAQYDTAFWLHGNK